MKKSKAQEEQGRRNRIKDTLLVKRLKEVFFNAESGLRWEALGNEVQAALERMKREKEELQDKLDQKAEHIKRLEARHADQFDQITDLKQRLDKR